MVMQAELMLGLRIWVTTLTGINSFIFWAHICIINSTYKVKLKKPLSAYICASLLDYWW